MWTMQNSCVPSWTVNSTSSVRHVWTSPPCPISRPPGPIVYHGHGKFTMAFVSPVINKEPSLLDLTPKHVTINERYVSDLDKNKIFHETIWQILLGLLTQFQTRGPMQRIGTAVSEIQPSRVRLRWKKTQYVFPLVQWIINTWMFRVMLQYNLFNI